MHKHVKDHAEGIKSLTNELQILKSKVQRPTTELPKAKNEPRVVRKLTDLVKSPISTHATRKVVKFVFVQFEKLQFFFCRLFKAAKKIQLQ